MQALKERLNRGVRLDLDDEEFSVHECAAVRTRCTWCMQLYLHGTMQVLKQFLANLPEPLLTDAYYQAHCQVLPARIDSTTSTVLPGIAS